MKKFIFVTLAVLLCTALVAPAVMAQPGTPEEAVTGVTVQSGLGTPPVIKAKWEQDRTASLEDGDPTHQTPGSQFLPPQQWCVQKWIDYYVVVMDADGKENINLVMVDIYHPFGYPCEGSKKYQIEMVEVDCIPGSAASPARGAFEAAAAANLVAYNSGFDYGEVWEEIDQCSARVFWGEAPLTYHQPAGDYLVVADAYDFGGNWASDGMTDLSNYFTYLPIPAIEVDFEAIDYGSAPVCNWKQVDGDYVFDDPANVGVAGNSVDAAFGATVRNIGNVPVMIEILQDDMDFSCRGTNCEDWNVEYKARLGATVNIAGPYDPYVPTMIPDILCNCNTNKLDLWIHIEKDPPGTDVHDGTISLTPYGQSFTGLCPCPPLVPPECPPDGGG
jgi:hypothetical protein